MEQRFISWNIENWITITLMVALGYLAMVLISQGFRVAGIGSSLGAGPVGNVVQFPGAAAG